MILRDENSNSVGPANQKGLFHEKLIEAIMENGNLTTTAGGMFIKQSDTNYYKFEVMARCSLSDFQIIKTIATNKTSRKFYTPRRILRGETAIREIEVVFEEIPNVAENKKYNNDIVEFSTIMLEVIT